MVCMETLLISVEINAVSNSDFQVFQFKGLLSIHMVLN